jgi:hypothetical protein
MLTISTVHTAASSQVYLSKQSGGVEKHHFGLVE